MIARKGSGRWPQRVTLTICLTAWAVAFWLTHAPTGDLPPLEVSDKTLHLCGYAGLASLFWLTLWAWGHPAGRRIVLSLAVLPCYGALDEHTQRYVQGRAASVHDWFFDCLGVLLALTVWETVFLLRSKRRRTAMQNANCKLKNAK